MSPKDRVAHAFRQHRAVVEAVAGRILRDRDEARDVASDTFLALIESGPVAEHAERSWLLTSARNRALNRVRDRSADARKAQRALPEAPPRPDEAAFGDDAAAELVRRALERLSKRDADAVRLRFMEELGYDEIASALGVSTAQARVVVHRAARRLRAETVTLLAQHHGAGPACTKRLVQRVRTHTGCATCGAVVDEVDALSSLGIGLVFLPVLHRFGGPLVRGITRVRARMPATGGKITEAFLAAAVAGSMAVTPAVAGTGFGGLSPARAIAVGITQAGTSGGGAAQTDVAPKLRSSDALSAKQAVVQDPSEDTHDVVYDNSLRQLGVPAVVADALDVHGHDGIDIRSFEIGALADRTGRTAGIVLRFVLAGPVPAGATYGVNWTFENGCAAEARLDWSSSDQVRWGDATMYRVACPEAAPPAGSSHANFWYDESGSQGGSYQDQASEVFPAHVNGRVVEMPLVFGDFHEGLLKLLRPGALLKSVSAFTELPPYRDQAPDEDTGIDYRVPK